eukprot:4915800-Prymnesium_polylepis.1
MHVDERAALAAHLTAATEFAGLSGENPRAAWGTWGQRSIRFARVTLVPSAPLALHSINASSGIVVDAGARRVEVALVRAACVVEAVDVPIGEDGASSATLLNDVCSHARRMLAVDAADAKRARVAGGSALGAVEPHASGGGVAAHGKDASGAGADADGLDGRVRRGEACDVHVPEGGILAEELLGEKEEEVKAAATGAGQEKGRAGEHEPLECVMVVGGNS